MADPDATADHDRVDLDRLVHEPARLRLLTCLFAVESADFLVVMRQAGLTQGNLSSHMTRLEAAGYLQIEKAFVDRRPRTLLRLTATGRTALERYAVSMKRLLAGLHTPDTVKSKPGTAASEPELETASCHHLGDG